MPRRGGLPLFYLVAERLYFVAERLYFVARRSGYQQGNINNGRSPQNFIERSCVSAKLSDTILRDDELIYFTPSWNLRQCQQIDRFAWPIVRGLGSIMHNILA